MEKVVNLIPGITPLPAVETIQHNNALTLVVNNQLDVDVAGSFSWGLVGDSEETFLPLKDANGDDISLSISAANSDGVILKDLFASLIKLTFSYTGSADKPTIATITETDLDVDKATIGATVDPKLSATVVFLEYGKTNKFGTKAELEDPIAKDAGASLVSFALEDLEQGVKYFYKITAINSIGTTVSTVGDFTTQTLPTISDIKVTPAADGCKIEFKVNPGGLATNAKVQYGADAEYGSEATLTEIEAGDADVACEVNLSELTAETTYHFRIVAENTVDEVMTDDMTFTTLEEVEEG